MLINCILVSLFAFVVSFSLFKPSVYLANVLGAIDIPNERKIHSKPTSRLGGLSFFIAFCVMLPLLPIDASYKISLILGGGVIFCVGMLDDAINISPFAKLCGEFLAVSVYIFLSFLKTDTLVEKLFGIGSLLWMIFIINATNLCDGLDGLAGGITCTQALSLATVSLVFGSYGVFWCSILLLFATLGFLPRNMPPAKTFMGDCGALFLGFILSALSTRLIYETRSILLLLSMPLIFRIPTSDAILSFFRRALKKKNPFSADRGHFHHKLLDTGFTRECAALALISISLLFGTLAIFICSI